MHRVMVFVRMMSYEISIWQEAKRCGNGAD